jgi:hypothetical protein
VPTIPGATAELFPLPFGLRDLQPRYCVRVLLKAIDKNNAMVEAKLIFESLERKLRWDDRVCPYGPQVIASGTDGKEIFFSLELDDDKTAHWVRWKYKKWNFVYNPIYTDLEIAAALEGLEQRHFVEIVSVDGKPYETKAARMAREDAATAREKKLLRRQKVDRFKRLLGKYFKQTPVCL